jgi:hypothetical protein
MIIDIHAHIIPPAALRERHSGQAWWPRVYRDASGGQLIELGGSTMGAAPREMSDIGRIVAEQDAAGVEVVVLSPPPFVLGYERPAEQGHAICRVQNDAIAQITSGTAPQTANSSHPNSAFWMDVEGGMFYDAGYWYYNDGKLLANAENRLITTGNLKKTAYGSFFGTGTTIAENASFAAFDGGNLYYFDHAAHCIKRYNLKGAETVNLLYYSAGEVVSELGIGPINLFTADNPEGSLVPKQRLLYVLHGGGMTSVLTHDVSAYFGDLNSDGRANENDALLICDYKISMALDSAQLALADVNRDGRIDLLDALEICR